MIANENNRGLNIGLNSAWRDAVTHMIVVEGWIDGSPRDAIEGIYDDITFNKTHALRQLDPDSGAYFNEVGRTNPLTSISLQACVDISILVRPI
jgi:hypothetical protein